MKKLLLVGLVGLSSLFVNAATYGELKAKADEMSDSALCTTMGIITRTVELGKQHDPQAVRNMNVIFLDRFEKMDEEQVGVCEMAFAIGKMAAEEG